jgi:hypothetical protein
MGKPRARAWSITLQARGSYVSRLRLESLKPVGETLGLRHSRVMQNVTPHIGSCHCGNVTLTITSRPAYLNDCNCSLCTKTGALWGYFDPSTVTITGAAAGYVRRDLKTPFLTTHFCPHCGVTTHWSPLPRAHQDRMGINMRLFDDVTVEDIELRQADGRSWDPDQ